MIQKGELILADDKYYDMDCYRTKLNNNVPVVGTSGAGKTRSIVSPNIMQATGSYIISDPKGNLYGKYKSYLEERGYEVKKLDFTDPVHSIHYNFFSYIRDELLNQSIGKSPKTYNLTAEISALEKAIKS